MVRFPRWWSTNSSTNRLTKPLTFTVWLTKGSTFWSTVSLTLWLTFGSTVLFTLLSTPLAMAAQGAVPLEQSLAPLMDRAGQIEIPLPRTDPEAEAAAEDLYQLYTSEPFQTQLDRERRRLAEEYFGVKKNEGHIKEPSERKDTSHLGRIYLLVSSSMPLTTLRNYALDLERLHDPRLVMALRGFVGGAGKIGPTAAFIAQVLQVDPDCKPGVNRECALRDFSIQVDPLVFRQFGITQVPAVVYEPESGNYHDRTLEPLIVYGDAGLGYALELLARETGNRELERLAARFEPIP